MHHLTQWCITWQQIAAYLKLGSWPQTYLVWFGRRNTSFAYESRLSPQLTCCWHTARAGKERTSSEGHIQRLPVDKSKASYQQSQPFWAWVYLLVQPLSLRGLRKMK
jgi:hypothetical protein